MIHPHTQLKYINDAVGYGVFATAFIPKGTITYVKDSLEMVISPTDYLLHNTEVKAMIDKYSYIDPKGNRIVSWDFAKYVNHCCHCNTMSTGYGFEIAICDIKEGEQITDEYGIFNLDKEMEVMCGQGGCRRVLKPSDFDNYYREWDTTIIEAMKYLLNTAQPLMPFIDEDTRKELDEYHLNPGMYKSVFALKQLA